MLGSGIFKPSGVSVYLMWLVRCSLRPKVFPQSSHLKSLSPVCILIIKKWIMVRNVLQLDINHLICRTRFCFWANVFLQCSHMKGFSRVCTLKEKYILWLACFYDWSVYVDHLICRTTSILYLNFFPQCSHLNGFSPVCTLKRKNILR